MRKILVEKFLKIEKKTTIFGAERILLIIFVIINHL